VILGLQPRIRPVLGEAPAGTSSMLRRPGQLRLLLPRRRSAMSRGQARRELDLDTFRAEMEGKAWLADQAAELLDEDPRPYKDVDQVMADQTDLVRPLHTLSQILNYNGL
jgi:hypothetical protein